MVINEYANCTLYAQLNEETVFLFVLLTVNFVMHIDCSVQSYGICMYYPFKNAGIYAMCLHLFSSFTEHM